MSHKKKPTPASLPFTLDQIVRIPTLVVEDTPDNRRLLVQFLLEWWNLQPDEAENGARALEAAKKKQYGLILQDLRTPEVDGFETARLIRQLPGYEKVPILALTDDPEPAVKQRAAAGLFDAVLPKPFDGEELRRKILELTHKR